MNSFRQNCLCPVGCVLIAPVVADRGDQVVLPDCQRDLPRSGELDLDRLLDEEAHTALGRLDLVVLVRERRQADVERVEPGRLEHAPEGWVGFAPREAAARDLGLVRDQVEEPDHLRVRDPLQVAEVVRGDASGPDEPDPDSHGILPDVWLSRLVRFPR